MLWTIKHLNNIRLYNLLLFLLLQPFGQILDFMIIFVATLYVVHLGFLFHSEADIFDVLVNEANIEVFVAIFDQTEKVVVTNTVVLIHVKHRECHLLEGVDVLQEVSLSVVGVIDEDFIDFFVKLFESLGVVPLEECTELVADPGWVPFGKELLQDVLLESHIVDTFVLVFLIDATH